MTTELTIRIKVTTGELDNPDKIASIHYPDEGNTITITKGLNTVELSDAIHHEIGHLIDWYLSEGKQSSYTHIRETNANVIGDAIRFKTHSPTCAVKVASTEEHCPEPGLHRIEGTDDYLCDRCYENWLRQHTQPKPPEYK